MNLLLQARIRCPEREASFVSYSFRAGRLLFTPASSASRSRDTLHEARWTLSPRTVMNNAG